MIRQSSSTHALNIASKSAERSKSRWPRRLSVLIVAAATIAFGSPIKAQGSKEVEFDLIERNDSLAVLLDLSFLLTSAHISRLRDGIDLGIECRMTVRRPRKLFGSVKLTEQTTFCRLGFQLLTKGYQLTTAYPGRSDTVSLTSLSRLHEYMTDSVVFTILKLDSLDRESRHVLDIEISAISLNSINLASGEDDPEADRSPLKLLFEQFLVLTDYGRETFSTSSRPFSRSEITSRQ